jgi:hypothetical protein
MSILNPTRFHISFDLDDCLVCYDPAVPRDRRVPFFVRPWFREPLRAGTLSLMKQLATSGCDISIFTSSYRPQRYIRWWFGWHRVRLRLVINRPVYDEAVKPDANWQRPSKYTKPFGIDLHVDDSEGVKLEGEQHGFAVLVVHPEDTGWRSVFSTR